MMQEKKNLVLKIKKSKKTQLFYHKLQHFVKTKKNLKKKIHLKKKKKT